MASKSHGFPSSPPAGWCRRRYAPPWSRGSPWPFPRRRWRRGPWPRRRWQRCCRCCWSCTWGGLKTSDFSGNMAIFGALSMNIVGIWDDSTRKNGDVSKKSKKHWDLIPLIIEDLSIKHWSNHGNPEIAEKRENCLVGNVRCHQEVSPPAIKRGNGKSPIYPLVNVYITMEHHHFTAGYIHYFYGHGFQFANCNSHYQRL